MGPTPAYNTGYDQWAAVVINPLRNAGGGSSSPGIDTSPTGYTSIDRGKVTHGDIVSTSGGFPSWRGTAPPPGSFDGQFGTFLYFPFGVRAIGGQVSLSAPGTPATTTVDAIYYTGYAVSFSLDPTFPGGSNQDWLNYTTQAAWLLGNFPLSVCVSATSGADSVSDCASVSFYNPNGIPEPGTWGLACAGLLALALMRHRR